MTLHANLTETDEFCVFTIYTTSPGDVDDPGFYEVRATSYPHVMLLADGELSVSEDGGRIYRVTSPGVIWMKRGVSYWFQNMPHGLDPLQPNLLYCVHNKTTLGWDDLIERVVELLRVKNTAEPTAEANP